MASFDKMNFLSPPVLNVAMDPESEDDMYLIKLMADALTERIGITDDYYMLKKLAQNLIVVCDVILESGNKKSPGRGNSQEPF